MRTVRVPASKPLTGPGTVKKPPPAKPRPSLSTPAGSKSAAVLTVTRAYVHSQTKTVYIDIRNTNNGHLPADRYMTVKLAVQLANAMPARWPLARMDPRRTGFRNGLTFDTGRCFLPRAPDSI